MWDNKLIKFVFWFSLNNNEENNNNKLKGVKPTNPLHLFHMLEIGLLIQAFVAYENTMCKKKKKEIAV